MQMRLKFKRKAVLFSLISVLFAILFITLFSQSFNTLYEDRIPGSNIRIKVMDTYTRNFERYIGESIKISAYKALNNITIYNREHNSNRFFIDSQEFNDTFENCMICGYTDCLDRKPFNDCGIQSNNLTARLNSITQLSETQLNIKTQYTINSVKVSQENAFEVEVTLNISYNITDNSSTESSLYYAKWTKEKVIVQPVTIIGLYDPKGYLNDSTNYYNKTIVRYSGICEYNESCWNIENVTEFYITNSTRYYKNGASFLNRYWNNMNASSCCGLETILHPITDINPIYNVNNSYIDNHYWDGTYTCKTGQKIVSVIIGSDDVHLDQSVASRYQITNSSLIYCNVTG